MRFKYGGKIHSHTHSISSFVQQIVQTLKPGLNLLSHASPGRFASLLKVMLLSSVQIFGGGGGTKAENFARVQGVIKIIQNRVCLWARGFLFVSSLIKIHSCRPSKRRGNLRKNWRVKGFKVLKLMLTIVPTIHIEIFVGPKAKIIEVFPSFCSILDQNTPV